MNQTTQTVQNQWKEVKVVRVDVKKKINGTRSVSLYDTSKGYQLMSRVCQYRFMNMATRETKWVMYNLVYAKGQVFVQAVGVLWAERDQAGTVTALQKQAQLNGFA